MRCEQCGRKDAVLEDGRRVPSHHLGCPAGHSAQSAPQTSSLAPSGCAREGCSKPVAASKGPRPGKYCDEHKTTRSK